MYKSLKEYAKINEADDSNSYSKRILNTMKKFGFTFDSTSKVKYPAAVIKRGKVEAIYVNCYKKTQWYTINIAYVNNKPSFSLAMKNNNIENTMNIMTQLRSDLESASNLMSELALGFNAFGDFDKLPKIEL